MPFNPHLTSRTGIMLCYPFDERRLKGTMRNSWTPPFITQPKIDGIRCRVIITSKNTLLLSSTEHIIYSMPHIQQEIQQTINQPIELDGELYAHHLPFEQICSIVNRESVHPQHQEISLHIFDIVNEHQEQITRLQTLNTLFQNHKFKHIAKVPSIICSNFDDVMTEYKNYLNQNYEGIIVRTINNHYVRKRSTQLMKFKPKKHDAYKISNFKQEISQNGILKPSLGAVQCHPFDDPSALFWVGSGFTKEQRTTLWQNRNSLIGQTIIVEYQHLTQNHIPRFPVVNKIISTPPNTTSEQELLAKCV